MAKKVRGKRIPVPYADPKTAVRYEIAEDEEIPDRLIEQEQRWAKTERWRARLDL